MAFDEGLADRVREALGSRKGITEVKMFGGIGFMLDGKMCTGVHGFELIVRVSPDEHERLLKEPGVRPFDMAPRPMKGFYFVGGSGIRTKQALQKWVNRGVEFADSLPAKKAKPPAKRTR